MLLYCHGHTVYDFLPEGTSRPTTKSRDQKVEKSQREKEKAAKAKGPGTSSNNSAAAAAVAAPSAAVVKREKPASHEAARS